MDLSELYYLGIALVVLLAFVLGVGWYEWVFRR